MILSAHSVFLPYSDFIQSYGFKIHEDHDNWVGYRSSISRLPSIGSNDLCVGEWWLCLISDISR